MKEINKTKINTNNSWGFGGWYGHLIQYDNGMFLEKGKNCYRHTGTSKHNEWNYSENGDPYLREYVRGTFGGSVYKIQATENENHSYFIFAKDQQEADTKAKKDFNYTYTATKLIDL